MAQLIACPECTKPLQVPDDLLGTKVQCPECKHTFTAASSPAEAPDGVAPASRVSKRSKRKIDDDIRDDDDDDDDDRDNLNISRRRRQKPGKVTAIGVMALVGGIYAILWALGWAGGSFGICCLWPGVYYSIVVGIFAIVKGSALLGGDASGNAPPIGVAIMMIINIINADVLSCILGVVILIFCNDDEVKDYLAK